MLDILPMNDTIVLFGKDGLDDWGLPIKSDPVEVKGNYRYNTTRDTVVNGNGDEIVYSANVYLPFETEITYDSKVQFKDEFGQLITKKPITIQHKRDFWGNPVVLRVVV